MLKQLAPESLPAQSLTWHLSQAYCVTFRFPLLRQTTQSENEVFAGLDLHFCRLNFKR